LAPKLPLLAQLVDEQLARQRLLAPVSLALVPVAPGEAHSARQIGSVGPKK
jgi:hypothetical protein